MREGLKFERRQRAGLVRREGEDGGGWWGSAENELLVIGVGDGFGALVTDGVELADRLAVAEGWRSGRGKRSACEGCESAGRTTLEGGCDDRVDESSPESIGEPSILGA